MEIVSRKEALKHNLVRYFTGKPCKHGHLCERTVSTGCIICSKIKSKKSRKHKYKTDQVFVERQRLLNRISYKKNRTHILKKKKESRRKHFHREFVRRSLERLFTGVNFGSTDYVKVVGYTQKELKDHLENLFSEGMSFKNHGLWHIDHIKPLSLFLKEGITDPKIINALSNLQPLWAIENLQKGAKYQE